ncbi:lipase family protein [Actinomycetospora aeridis]|uniref:Lipase family protein n=1 Tax=Actinomycetospora aeridis TaxID=3129231 RepID=A0ABU8N0A9_9PSEU
MMSLALAALVLTASPAGAAPADRVPADRGGSAGSVVSAVPLAAPLPGRATRVLYRSTDTEGRANTVSGTVIVPLAPPPGPLRLVSYAAGTQGLADRCAPSRQFAAGTEYEAPFVSTLLTAGFAVAVTDYEGLGTPGEHTYVNRASQAHAVLDMARAAQTLDVGIPPDGPVGLAGYSQGGGASAAAVELAPSYAPELDLVGAYAGAVPADLAEVAAFLDGKPGAGLLAYAVNGFRAAYPELPIDGLLNDRGRAILAETRDQCVGDTVARYPGTRTETLTRDGRPLTAILDEEPFRSRVEEQRIGARTPGAPVLIVHSLADDIVPIEQDRELAERWCARGATVQFVPTPVPTHVGGAVPGFAAAVPFLESRFAGREAVSTCD